jgi:hypothetical protein
MTLNPNLDYELSLRDEKKSFFICEEHSIFRWKTGRTLLIFRIFDFSRIFNLLLEKKKTLI